MTNRSGKLCKSKSKRIRKHKGKGTRRRGKCEPLLKSPIEHLFDRPARQSSLCKTY